MADRISPETGPLSESERTELGRVLTEAAGLIASLQYGLARAGHSRRVMRAGVSQARGCLDQAGAVLAGAPREHLMDTDPRELTPGYVFANRNLGTAWGVLRDGRTVIWTCSGAPTRHKPHAIPTRAGQCAQAELDRRLQGAQEVLWALHCRPCDIFWDLAWLSRYRPGEPPERDVGHWLLRGLCPRCEVPASRVKIAVLERQEASVR